MSACTIMIWVNFSSPPILALKSFEFLPWIEPGAASVKLPQKFVHSINILQVLGFACLKLYEYTTINLQLSAQLKSPSEKNYLALKSLRSSEYCNKVLSA